MTSMILNIQNKKKTKQKLLYRFKLEAKLPLDFRLG